jgi:hypothetical protein
VRRWRVDVTVWICGLPTLGLPGDAWASDRLFGAGDLGIRRIQVSIAVVRMMNERIFFIFFARCFFFQFSVTLVCLAGLTFGRFQKRGHVIIQVQTRRLLNVGVSAHFVEVFTSCPGGEYYWALNCNCSCLAVALKMLH